METELQAALITSPNTDNKTLETLNKVPLSFYHGLVDKAAHKEKHTVVSAFSGVYYDHKEDYVPWPSMDTLLKTIALHTNGNFMLQVSDGKAHIKCVDKRDKVLAAESDSIYVGLLKLVSMLYTEEVRDVEKTDGMGDVL